MGGRAYLQVTTYDNSTSCISNFNLSGYSPNERCSFTSLRPVTVYSPHFSTEGYFDRLVINGQAYSGTVADGVSGPNGVRVSVGSNITWESDYSIGSYGFTVCVVPAFTVIGSARETQCNVSSLSTPRSFCTHHRMPTDCCHAVAVLTETVC